MSVQISVVIGFCLISCLFPAIIIWYCGTSYSVTHPTSCEPGRLSEDTSYGRTTTIWV
jgi:hypothetical protein